SRARSPRQRPRRNAGRPSARARRSRRRDRSGRGALETREERCAGLDGRAGHERTPARDVRPGRAIGRRDAELLADARAQVRHVRIEEISRDPDRLEAGVQRAIHLGLARRVLRELPRLRALEVAVGLLDQREGRGQRVAEVQHRRRVVVLTQRALGTLAHRALGIALARRGRPAAAIALDHRRGARHEVAEIVREVGVEPLLERLGRDRRVLLERGLAQHEIARRVDAPFLGRRDRIDHVAARLREPLSPVLEEAVDEHLPRQLDARGHQHRRPVDAVEAADVLADDVHVARPPLLELRLVGAEAHAGDVVDERVEPHVHGVVGIPRPRHTPFDPPPARDADVLQPAVEPPEDLVAPDLRDGEVRSLLEQLAQLLLVLREPEEEVLLLHALHGIGVVRMELAAAVDEVRLLVERLAADAVQTLVRAEIDVVVRDPAAHELLDAGDVIGVRRADEPVVRDVPGVRHLPELRGVLVDERARVDARRLRGLHVLRAVLVGPGEEEDLAAALALEPGERVRPGELVRVVEPGTVVHVGDGGRDVELHGDPLGILGRHGRHTSIVNRVALRVLSRVLLVLFTFVLIVALAQLALVAASTRAQHIGLDEVIRRAWEGTQDYFSSLLQGSLGEATSTSILGNRRRSMGEVLLDAYPKSMMLVGLAVIVATALGVLVGTAAAATSSRRVRGALLGITVLAVSTPSFLLAILLILLSATMVSRYGIRLWPSFGF